MSIIFKGVQNFQLSDYAIYFYFSHTSFSEKSYSTVEIIRSYSICDVNVNCEIRNLMKSLWKANESDAHKVSCTSLEVGLRKRVGLGCRIKANCPLVRPGPVRIVPSVGVFLRDPSLYLREFLRKPRKTPND